MSAGSTITLEQGTRCVLCGFRMEDGDRFIIFTELKEFPPGEAAVAHEPCFERMPAWLQQRLVPPAP